MMTRLAAVALLCAAPAFAQEADGDWDARISSVRGEVAVITAEDPEGVPADHGMPLEPGDRVRTGAESSAEIALDDQSLIYLRSNSEFTLESIKRDDSKFRLLLGSLLAKIRSLGSGSLEVRTPDAVAAVRGTEFGVELDAENQGVAHFGVFDEGRLEVRGSADSHSELLIANQETEVVRGARPRRPYILKRFVAHRRSVRGFKGRLQAMRRGYRPLVGAQRRERRGLAMTQMRERRQRTRKEMEERRQRRRRGPEPDAETLRNREEMQKRKQRIRERRRGQ